jgi:hypothetical protein
MSLLIGGLSVAVIALAGCGESQAPMTSPAEVQELAQALREADAFHKEYAPSILNASKSRNPSKKSVFKNCSILPSRG